MTAITNALFPCLAARRQFRTRRARFLAPTAAQEAQVLFALALIVLAGGAALVLRALSAVAAFD